MFVSAAVTFLFLLLIISATAALGPAVFFLRGFCIGCLATCLRSCLSGAYL